MIFSCGAFAKATKVTKKNNQKVNLSEVLKKYRTTALVKMNVVKRVKSELLDKETLYKGQVYLAQGKFRWDNDTPEKTQIIFDGKTVWNIQHPPPELPGPLQIAKAKVDKSTKKQILISTLLSENGINENFKIIKTTQENNDTTYDLEPKGKDLGVTSLKLKTDRQRTISELSYKDDVGNQTIIQFSNSEFLKKSQSKLFEYAPPKGAQVTNL